MTRPVVAAALLCAFLWPQAPAPKPPDPQVFRSAVELIAIDVQVIDRRGVPVAGLGPDRFEVTVDGRRRRVVSAAFLDEHSIAAGDSPTAAPADAPTTPAGLPAPGGRVVILAIDAGSFEAAAANSVATAGALAARAASPGRPRRPVYVSAGPED